ncbi:MAG TPA: TonB-dependent receptor, partial [Anaeromyxobacteraceae bacterium]
MLLRLKILTAAVITCALAGAPGVVLAQDPNQTPPAQPAPAPTDPSSTPASPPSSDTVQPNAPAPSPTVNPSDVATPAPGQPAAVEETVGAPGAGRRGGKQFGEEIVVTGSRIRRKDLTTPAPVTVLNREAVQASGKVSVGDFLQSLPEQGNAINTGVN